ncbi:hypothetical protein [Duganella aceris]|uniref:DUF3108 domain-containing protein n=1 Tax=Duganella aceris TaxID=2703883 RepID=A0ABX0FUC4_9BURK|nr:hypothetical protein [Duganella aceris]NGZ88145.1 hypothetical protein [Duganella aceris]
MNLPKKKILAGFCLGLITQTALAADALDAQLLKPCGKVFGPLLSLETTFLPTTDSEVEVEIGQSMVSTHHTSIMDGATSYGFYFDKGLQFSGKVLGTEYDVDVPPSAASIHDKEQYIPTEYTFKYRNSDTPRTGWLKPILRFEIDEKSRSVIARLNIGFGHKVDVGMASAEKSEKCTRSDLKSYKKELVYSGISQGTISILYREYMGDLLRPAFSQELRYDLKDGDEIGYKGARFKVIKANNVSIKYKVTKHLQQ